MNFICLQFSFSAIIYLAKSRNLSKYTVYVFKIFQRTREQKICEIEEGKSSSMNVCFEALEAEHCM